MPKLTESTFAWWDAKGGDLSTMTAQDWLDAVPDIEAIVAEAKAMHGTWKTVKESHAAEAFKVEEARKVLQVSLCNDPTCPCTTALTKLGG